MLFLSLRHYSEVKYNPPKYLIYWTLQGVWVWVSALPLWLVCGTPRQPGLYWADYLSLGIWAVGFVMEVTADLQKRSFKADPANKVGRCKLDPGLKAPWFQKFNLMKRSLLST